MGDRANPQTRSQSRDTAPGVAVVTILDLYLDWLLKRVQEGTKAQRTYDWYFNYLQSFTRFGTTDFRVAQLTIDRFEPFHVYQWVDAQAGWSGDLNEIDSVAEGILKRLTGQDNVTVDRKNLPLITMAPSVKLIFATMHFHDSRTEVAGSGGGSSSCHSG